MELYGALWSPMEPYGALWRLKSNNPTHGGWGITQRHGSQMARFSKAMSALIHYANQDKINKDSSVVFIHSGGIPNIFTYANELNNN